MMDKKNNDKATRRTMPTADDLLSSSETMSKDECKQSKNAFY
jgi:hypothetical protein